MKNYVIFAAWFLTACQSTLYEISEFEPDEFEDFLKREDANREIRRTAMLITDYDIDASEYGHYIDKFLMSRPWWYVEHEPYDWKYFGNSARYVVLKKYSPDLENIYRKFAEVNYPSICADKYIRFAFHTGFDSFGHYFYEFGNNLGSLPDQWMSVAIPYVIDHDTRGIVYLDEHSCPTVTNKYECLFLNATNCTIPDIVVHSAKKNIAPPHPIYTSATENGQPMARDDYHNILKDKTHKPMSLPDMIVEQYIPRDQSLTPENYILKPRRYNSHHELSIYGLFFRLNFDFRSQIAEYLYHFKLTQTKPFPPIGDCVALHIRRGDRSPKKEEMLSEDHNARDWCRTHQKMSNGSCFNADTNEVILDESYCWHIADYGCNTKTPYGSLVLSEFLAASRVVSNSSNVIIITDSSDAIEVELEAIKEERNIFLLPTPHFHRAKSTANGIAYIAAIELASQCPAFVGHSGSAVTMFMMRVMCARHVGIYGSCPKFYDFGDVERRRKR